ncbi:MAG: hypothetical protein KJ069_20570 [Anaerolineae bacterium]|nr:hypothetical protein [Anaerolineae bacterium]
MDQTTQTHLANIEAEDKTLQNAAYYYLMEATAVPVAWAYEAWDELVAGLTHKDNHVRAISSQLLCQLVKSDPEKRILTDFEKLLTVTKDERFVTARHCLQSLWKVGVVGPAQQQIVVDGLDGRYRECIAEKNSTLIRFDIIQGLGNLYDAAQDETIKERALALIEMESDPKYRKKYATVWKSR